MSRYTTGCKGRNGGHSSKMGSTGRVCRRGAARGCAETMTPDAAPSYGRVLWQSSGISHVQHSE